MTLDKIQLKRLSSFNSELFCVYTDYITSLVGTIIKREVFYLFDYFYYYKKRHLQDNKPDKIKQIFEAANIHKSIKKIGYQFHFICSVYRYRQETSDK